MSEWISADTIKYSMCSLKWTDCGNVWVMHEIEVIGVRSEFERCYTIQSLLDLDRYWDESPHLGRQRYDLRSEVGSEENGRLILEHRLKLFATLQTRNTTSSWYLPRFVSARLVCLVRFLRLLWLCQQKVFQAVTVWQVYLYRHQLLSHHLWGRLHQWVSVDNHEGWACQHRRQSQTLIVQVYQACRGEHH